MYNILFQEVLAQLTSSKNNSVSWLHLQDQIQVSTIEKNILEQSDS